MAKIISNSFNVTPVYDGQDGPQGPPGNEGTGIASIAATFNLSKNGTSTNETTAPTDLYYNTWQSSQPAPNDTYPYVWKKEVTTYKNPTSNETKYYCIAAKGTKGETGPMFYLCGQFPDKAPYSKDDYRCPVVYYGGEYWYLKADRASGSDEPFVGSSKWGKATSFDMVFTDVLFVKDFAKLGSGIISGDWLISCAGYIVNNDVKTYYGPESTYANKPAYLRFDPDYPNSDNGYQNFMPVYAVDLKTGKTYQQDAYVAGVINAKTIYQGQQSPALNSTIDPANGALIMIPDADVAVQSYLYLPLAANYPFVELTLYNYARSQSRSWDLPRICATGNEQIRIRTNRASGFPSKNYCKGFDPYSGGIIKLYSIGNDWILDADETNMNFYD